VSARHTPGPWAVFHDHPNPETARSLGHIRPADGTSGAWKWGFTEIADCFGCEHPEQAANARLIASAPKLYDALQLCVTWYAKRSEGIEPGTDYVLPIEQQPHEIQQAMLALAEATGGVPCR
jgi:hypothetical protein